MQKSQIEQFAVDEAKEANRLYAEVQACAKKAVGAARDARDRVLELGDLLNRVNSTLAHGQFLLWIKAHCKFGKSQAYVYMKLSNFRRAGNLPDEMSVRATMVALGIIPAQPHAPGRALNNAPDVYAPLNVFNRYLSALPSPEKELWRTDPAERAAMRQQYLPLRQWIDDLFSDTPALV